MNTYVLTGAAGFVGSNVLLELLRQGNKVLACDFSEPPGSLMEDAERCGPVQWIMMNVRDAGAWDALPQDSYRGVIHAAAVTAPEDDPTPISTAEVNLLGTLHAMDWALKREVPRLVFTSSSAVYRGTQPTGPMKEDQPVHPRFSYGLSKLAAEGFVAVYRERMGLDCCAVRLPSMYGPWERPTETRRDISPVYGLVRAAASGTAVKISGAKVSRDWTNVGDAARGLVHLASSVQGGPELLNLSTGRFVTLEEILDALNTLVPDNRIRLVGDHEASDLQMTGTSGNQPMDPSRLHSTGFRAKTSMEQGLHQYLAWWQEHDWR